MDAATIDWWAIAIIAAFAIIILIQWLIRPRRRSKGGFDYPPKG